MFDYDGIYELLSQYMEIGGFKAVISYGMLILEVFSDLYDFLFIIPVKDFILSVIGEIIVLFPDALESLILEFIDLFLSGFLEGLPRAPFAFFIMTLGLVWALLLVLLRYVGQIVDFVTDIIGGLT